MNPDALQASLMATFFEESFEGLERLESGLVHLDSDAGRDLIDDLFRAIHSIKGGAGVVGIAEVGPLAHAIESVFDRLRRGTRATAEMSAGLLRAVDVLRSALAARQAGRPTSGEACERAVAEVERLVGAAPTTAAARPEITLWSIGIAPRPDALRAKLDLLPVFDRLSEFGPAFVNAEVDAVPLLADLDPTRSYLRWDLMLSTSATQAELDSVVRWIDDTCDVTVAPIAAEAQPEPDPVAPPPAPVAEAGPAAPRDAREATPAGGSIRVSIDKIDALINMVGELVITQSMLGELDSEGPLDARRLARIREGLGQLARNTRSLQDSVMRLRSMSVGTVFNRFPRLVRELGERLGKEIALEITGQNTELDKAVLEKLSDPLVHLVRNAIDHGIEPTTDRVAAGKAAAGTIRLHAEHRGGDVVVEIADDGRGLDAARIVATARAKGLISADAVLDDRAAYQLVFLPGFSTAKEVSDLSGRGVGMDVVRRHVKELGGDIALDSRPGLGTRITLRLPLTLAIIDGQLVRLGEHQVVIPLLSITESVELEPSRTSRLGGTLDVYRLRDQLVPMLDLAGLLDLPRHTGQRQIMVVVTVDGTQVGLLVDEVLAQQQVVVKSLEANYHRVPGLAGATILGDGQVAFILDVVALVQAARAPSLIAAAAA
jgi:two-component system chemotaxis sensor kinase CheA